MLRTREVGRRACTEPGRGATGMAEAGQVSIALVRTLLMALTVAARVESFRRIYPMAPGVAPRRCA